MANAGRGVSGKELSHQIEKALHIFGEQHAAASGGRIKPLWRGHGKGYPKGMRPYKVGLCIDTLFYTPDTQNFQEAGGARPTGRYIDTFFGCNVLAKTEWFEKLKLVMKFPPDAFSPAAAFLVVITGRCIVDRHIASAGTWRGPAGAPRIRAFRPA